MIVTNPMGDPFETVYIHLRYWKANPQGFRVPVSLITSVQEPTVSTQN